MILELTSYVILFILSSLLVRAIFSFKNKSLHLLPSPPALPIIGHLHLISPLYHQSLHNLSSRYGPLMHIKFGFLSSVVVSTPELAKEFLKTHDLTFASHPSFTSIDHLTYNSSFAFAPHGPYWKFVKKLSITKLLNIRNLNQFLPIRTKELQYFLQILLNKSKVGESVNVGQELMKLTNNIISQLICGSRSSGTEDQAEEARTLVRETTQLFGELNISNFIWFFKFYDFQGFQKRYKDTHRRFDKWAEKIITDREEKRKKSKSERMCDEGDKPNDFLDLLLDISEDENSEIQLTRDRIKGLMLDFFTAGTDTAAGVIEWALAELINNPLVFKKAQKEIDEVVGQSRLVEESDIPNLPYLQAIIKETFRLHPPISTITRKSTQVCKINECTIPEGTLLFVNAWGIGRDPKYWENPLEFRPERFLKGNDGFGTDQIDVKGHHFQLLPFGTGRRICIGIPLAMPVVTSALAAMIQCFDWKVVNPDGVKLDGDNVLNMEESPGLSNPRKYDLVCVPVARFSTQSNILDP